MVIIFFKSRATEYFIFKDEARVYLGQYFFAFIGSLFIGDNDGERKGGEEACEEVIWFD